MWAFALSLAIYSWASEKFAWLVLHPLLPLILLAGIGVQALWERRGTRSGRGRARGRRGVALPTCRYASCWSTRSTAPTRASCSSPRSPRRRSSASPTEVAALARTNAADAPITVDSADGATFPYAWYFRDLNVGYVDLTHRRARRPTPTCSILTEAAATGSRRSLGGYDGPRSSRSASGGCATTASMSPGNWWRWFTERKPWNPTGGMPEWLYVRRRRADQPELPDVVPSRSNTRRPSASHFATPASP